MRLRVLRGLSVAFLFSIHSAYPCAQHIVSEAKKPARTSHNKFWTKMKIQTALWHLYNAGYDIDTTSLRKNQDPEARRLLAFVLSALVTPRQLADQAAVYFGSARLAADAIGLDGNALARQIKWDRDLVAKVLRALFDAGIPIRESLAFDNSQAMLDITRRVTGKPVTGTAVTKAVDTHFLDLKSAAEYARIDWEAASMMQRSWEKHSAPGDVNPYYLPKIREPWTWEVAFAVLRALHGKVPLGGLKAREDQSDEARQIIRETSSHDVTLAEFYKAIAGSLACWNPLLVQLGLLPSPWKAKWSQARADQVLAALEEKGIFLSRSTRALDFSEEIALITRPILGVSTSTTAVLIAMNKFHDRRSLDSRWKAVLKIQIRLPPIPEKLAYEYLALPDRDLPEPEWQSHPDGLHWKHLPAEDQTYWLSKLHGINYDILRKRQAYEDGLRRRAFSNNLERIQELESLLERAREIKSLMWKTNLRLSQADAEAFAQQSGLEYQDFLTEGAHAIHKAIDGYDPRVGLFSTYAVNAIQNEMRSYIRNESRRHIKGAGTAETESPLDPADTYPTQVQVYEEVERLEYIRRRVQELLFKLPTEDQQIVRMRFGFEGDPLSQKQVGLRIGCSGTHVGVLEGRILERLVDDARELEEVLN
ncbi:sigma-70 family RNA polymerase sigma factor [bacterium]|nr:sigma-70 family RNA polymerase sigma factor [bacterium]